MLSPGSDKGLCIVISFLTFIYNNILEAKYTETKENTKFIELETEVEVAALAFVQTQRTTISKSMQLAMGTDTELGRLIGKTSLEGA